MDASNASSNKINYNHCLEASIYSEEVKEASFKKLNKWTESGDLFTNGALFAFSLPIGFGLALGTLVTKVATVGEIIFKGVSNIVEGYKENDASKVNLGVKQLSIALPAAVLDLIFGAPIHMLHNVIGDTARIAMTVFSKISQKFGIDLKSNFIEQRKDHHKYKVAELKAAAGSLEDVMNFLMPLADPLNTLFRSQSNHAATFEGFMEMLKEAAPVVSPSFKMWTEGLNFALYGSILPKEIISLLKGSDSTHGYQNLDEV